MLTKSKSFPVHFFCSNRNTFDSAFSSSPFKWKTFLLLQAHKIKNRNLNCFKKEKLLLWQKVIIIVWYFGSAKKLLNKKKLRVITTARCLSIIFQKNFITKREEENMKLVKATERYETCWCSQSFKFLFVWELLLFFGSIRIQRPPRARNVIRNKGSNEVFPATGKNLKCLNIVEITVFISSIANLWPIWNEHKMNQLKINEHLKP